MKITKDTVPNILVCPLDWGLGHATRCVPLIRELISNGAKVIIASDKRPMEFLKQEFPMLEFICFKGYNISYPSKSGMVTHMLLSAPKILYHIYREHQELKKIISKYNISAIISDNRYGLWATSVPAIFITHQIRIKSPFLEGLLFRINCFFIRRFHECWIPDAEGKDNLSGELSHLNKLPLNTTFIGHLSRFNLDHEKPVEKKWDLAVILSGPEPQRSYFESIILSQLKTKALKAAIIRGVTESKENYRLNNNITIYSHLETRALKEVILSSELILCRPGYSTIMDLATLNKRAVFIPTPGQTEQEYLAKYMAEKGMGIYFSQKKFNIESIYLNSVNAVALSVKENLLLKAKVKAFMENLAC